MLPGMNRKPRIAIVGAGNLAAALAVSLQAAGYTIEAVITRLSGASLRRARKLAKEIGSQVFESPAALIRAEVFWFCVPDAQIAASAKALASRSDWKGRIALHSSGALASDELSVLRARGAAVASVHPLMTFVQGSRPALAGVPFAVEGDVPAVRVARRLIRDLGGRAYAIRKENKAAYHAWGTFASPLFAALLATTEDVASAAGISPKAARGRMLPILRQTLANYARLGAAGAFSGPIIRGDVDTIARHLRVLRGAPSASEVYVALARAALGTLPVRNKRALARILDFESSGVARRQ
jgi:predicted short-subunit dehydrogenase-like oxidoreductase (DUF2520 family)